MEPRRLGWQLRDLEISRPKGCKEVQATTLACPLLCPAAGIVFSNGQRWRTLRNFTLGALKEFGLGSRTIEERILEEAACLLGELQATVGEA